MSSEDDLSLRVAAQLGAHELLLRHLIVTVLARTEDPMDAFEGFQKRLSAPLRKRPIKDSENQEVDPADAITLEVVERIAKGVRDDIQRALGQVTPRRK